MKRLAFVAVAAGCMLSACGSVEYKDTNAAVDANPSCEQGSTRPGETVAPWCKREQSTTWSRDSKSKPVKFEDKDKDD